MSDNIPNKLLYSWERVEEKKKKKMSCIQKQISFLYLTGNNKRCNTIGLLGNRYKTA